MEKTPPPLTHTVEAPQEQILRRLSWASSDHGKNTKVCLVCRSYSSLGLIFDIFVLDLLSDKDRIPGDAASEDFKPRKPTFRLGEGCFPADAFCVVGSTLYMFQGFPQAPHGNSVAAFDLLPNLNKNKDDSTTVELLPSMLSITPDVLHPKTWPDAVPTGDDGKILVFSKFIKPAGCVDFELYDPRTRSVKQLPGLPPQKGRGFWIQGHTFHKEASTLYLHTQIGLFSLHLSSVGPGGGDQWESRARFFNFNTLPCEYGPSYVIGGDADQLLFAPSGVYDVKSESFAHQQLLCFLQLPFSFASRVFVILGDDDVSGDFDFCVVDGGGLDMTTSNNAPPYPRLAVSFCQSNANTLREENKRKITKREVLPDETIASFKFLLNADFEYYTFTPIDLFPLSLEV